MSQNDNPPSPQGSSLKQDILIGLFCVLIGPVPGAALIIALAFIHKFYITEQTGWMVVSIIAALIFAICLLVGFRTIKKINKRRN